MKKRNLKERFWARVVRSRKCWEFGGSPTTSGYGHIIYEGKSLAAHRVSWELHNGKIKRGLMVLHKCDNRLCVNPDHLFLGTHKDNMMDMRNKGRGKSPKGKSHSLSKLDENKVRMMREVRKKTQFPYHRIGKAFEVSKFVAMAICKRKMWGHVK